MEEAKARSSTAVQTGRSGARKARGVGRLSATHKQHQKGPEEKTTPWPVGLG
jgi:hypothetical protein